MKEYKVSLSVKITDEILVEANNPIDAADIGKELFLDKLTGEEAIKLIEDNLVANEVE